MRKILNLHSELTFIGKAIQELSNKNSWDLSVEATESFEKSSEAELYLMPVKNSWAQVKELPILTNKVQQLMACDVIHKEQGKWVPRLLVVDVFKRLVVEKAENMDLRHAAYVIGNGECARVAAGFCAQLGFKHVFLVDEKMGSNVETLIQLKRLYMGVRFEELESSRLVMQSILGSIIINGDDLTSQPYLLQDISYFNFLHENGFVLDAELGDEEKLLFGEALKAGLKTSSGYEMIYHYLKDILEILNIHWDESEDDAIEWLKTIPT